MLWLYGKSQFDSDTWKLTMQWEVYFAMVDDALAISLSDPLCFFFGPPKKAHVPSSQSLTLLPVAFAGHTL